ncbi:DUF1788 domain-containing protein [Bifidobacterium crudilactis]|uniref:DUF1788 domain-containing protein n=1 Tax=Bifidobacterium crudilactis TaxID=327277 RepID=UPI002353BFE3|nr:DUF1788 domain-containing protein [Bifidobacterium crudilactis]MCI1218828.1 DUF1788 domain-containing protein [Bifidobacterium crudilactis]
MTPAELNQQEEHLFDVMSGQRFLNMEGLSNEVPFFIYPYDPENAEEVMKARKRIANRLRQKGIIVRQIDLYSLSVEILKNRGVWSRLIGMESNQNKDEFCELIQGMLDPQTHLAPAIRERLADGAFDIVFLTGIGEVYPYIRSHTVLNNLQSVVVDKPMLMFFPGRYDQSDTLGSSLVLFGRLKDDQYYRAKDIREQEA